MNAGVTLCADLGAFGVDPEAVSGSLEAFGVPTAVVGGPCGRAGAADLPEWDRIVSAVCPEGPSVEEYRTLARRSGRDAIVGATRLDIVSATSYGPPDGRNDRALAVLRSRLAGLAATPETPPDSLRMALPAGNVSRRSLLSTAGLRYLPLASVGEAGCRGSAACGICVDACPVGAVGRGGRVPQVDRDACIGCAACVSACPVEGAARLPGADLIRFEAELAELLPLARGAGLVVGCGEDSRIPGDRVHGTWLPVEVPCLSIVTPAWVLTTLAAGVRAVALGGCGTACRAGATDRARSIVEFSRAALALAGVQDVEERIRLLLPEGDALQTLADPEDLSPLRTSAAAPGLREPAATASALAALGAVAGSITSDGAPFGRVTFDVEACTMCGLCAAVCPTGALRFDQGAVAASLELDRSACVGCGHCAAICPENALSIEPGIDLEDLGRPVRHLKRSPIARCRRCGHPVAPTAMLERLRPALEPALLLTIEGLCQRCRAAGIPSA